MKTLKPLGSASTKTNIQIEGVNPAQPSVTVIIPNHNYREYIVECVESVATQDYPNKRICVVDDNSKDGSFEEIASKIEGVRQFAVQLESHKVECVGGFFKGVPIIVLRAGELGGGPSQSRNLGMFCTQANTDIFGFLDADDLYLPGKISKSVFKLIENPALIGMVYSDYEVRNLLSGVTIHEFKEPFSRSRLLQECIINNDSLVSKLAISQCGNYDVAMRTCEDYDLWMRLTEKFLAVHIPEKLVAIRVTKHNSTDTVSKQAWNENYKRVFAKLQSRMQKH